MMLKVVFCSLVMIVTVNEIFAQVNESPLRSFRKDTTVVGVVIETDSIFSIINDSRAGTRYYYGVHHLKIGVIDIADSLIKDTMIVAYVYNIRTELKSYFKNFNIKAGNSYIFDLGLFSPCNSDFQKLEGRCDQNNEFYPVSNKLTKHYTKIYRVINLFKWNGIVKRTL
jgi:hypothetical protein